MISRRSWSHRFRSSLILISVDRSNLIRLCESSTPSTSIEIHVVVVVGFRSPHREYENPDSGRASSPSCVTNPIVVIDLFSIVVCLPSSLSSSLPTRRSKRYWSIRDVFRLWDTYRQYHLYLRRMHRLCIYLSTSYEPKYRYCEYLFSFYHATIVSVMCL